MDAIPLIGRKLSAPRIPEPHVHRPKPLAMLSRGLESSRRLTLVCAGPGYGKSTLVAAYTQETGLPSCWYTLDESDADLTTFLAYVAGALKTRFPGLGDRALELLRSAQAVESVTQTVVGVLAEELAELAEEGGLLILDDFHVVAGVPGILKATEYLMQYLPENWQLILTSRETPALSLPMLRVRQQLLEVGVRELRFSAGEVRELLRGLTGLQLSDGEALDVVGHTDGWVASVILAAQAVSGSGEEAKALLLRELGQPAALYSYLAQEVFSRQTPAMQAFLLRSALLPRLDAALCREGLGLEDAGDRIRLLMEGNLLIPLGDEPQEGYGFHPVFRRFLQDLLAERLPASELAALCTRLANHLAEAQPEEALTLFLRAEAHEAASGLVGRLAEGLLANNQLDRLQALLDRFPGAYASFETLFYAAEIKRLLGDFDKALGLFQRAEALAVRPEEAGRALVHQAAIWLGRGDACYEAALAVGEAQLARNDWSGLAFAANLRGAQALAANQANAAIARYEEALACYRQLEDSPGQIKVLNNLGLCYTRFGRFEAALATYGEAIAAAERADRYPNPMTLTNMAAIQCYQGRFQEAWASAARGLDVARLLNMKRDALYAHLVLGAASAGLADWRRAHEEYTAARDAALVLLDKAMAAKAYAGLAEVALLQGNQPRAQALLEQGLEQTGLPLEDPRQGDLAILLGLIRLEGGDFEGARVLLDRLESEFSALGFRYRQAQLAFYQARLAEKRGDAAQADARWARAAALAEAHDFPYLREQEERHRASPSAPPEPPRDTLAPAIRIKAFGDFQVTVGDRAVASRDWRGFKTKLILAYLLAHPHGVTKEQLTDLLYGELDTTRTAILVLISRLRHALEENLDKQTPSRFVQFVDGRYSFNFSLPFALDTQEFEYHLQRGGDALLSLAERRDHWRAAIGLYQGPYLAELAADAPWLSIERERYHRAAQEAHTALIRSYLADQDHAAALEAAEANLAFDPCAEFAHQVKMCVLARSGQRESALRHYGILQQIFERDLASPPSPATQALYHSISQGREAALPEFSFYTAP